MLKAAKCYLYDWTGIEDAGRRFENYVAVELKTRLSLWSDYSGETYSLFYIRDKQKREIDFLITKNRKPWLLVETKNTDSGIPKHHFEIQQALGGIPMVQICAEENICALQGKNVYRVSASRFLF